MQPHFFVARILINKLKVSLLKLFAFFLIVAISGKINKSQKPSQPLLTSFDLVEQLQAILKIRIINNFFFNDFNIFF